MLPALLKRRDRCRDSHTDRLGGASAGVGTGTPIPVSTTGTVGSLPRSWRPRHDDPSQAVRRRRLHFRRTGDAHPRVARTPRRPKAAYLLSWAFPGEAARRTCPTPEIAGLCEVLDKTPFSSDQAQRCWEGLGKVPARKDAKAYKPNGSAGGLRPLVRRPSYWAVQQGRPEAGPGAYPHPAVLAVSKGGS